MYNIYDIALLIPLALVCMYWWRTSEQKSVAVAAARNYCKERNLQLLDETLVFKRLRLERDLKKRRSLCRIYEFDYCETGEDRHSAEIILRGHSVQRIIARSDVLEITEFRR